MIDTEQFGLKHEPTIHESIKAGADLVSFSGDKLLGGPQAGIIIGRGEFINKLKKHPLARAIRADKMVLAALSATLLHYVKDEAINKIPVWQMISADAVDLRNRTSKWAAVIGNGCEIIKGESMVGGGSLPEQSLPTYLLAIQVSNPTRFTEKLRKEVPPVISRIDDDRVLFDPRTVLPNQDGTLVESVTSILNERK